MNKVLNSEQFKAHRSLFFQNNFNSPDEVNVSYLNDFDKTACQTYTIKKGELLYRQGEACNSLFIIRSGSIKNTTQNMAGITQVVGFYLMGDMVGFDGYFTGSYDSAAQALETVSVNKFSLDVLDKNCHITPGMQKKIFRKMSGEINRNHELLFLLGRMNAEERLAAFLLNFSSRMKQHLWKESEFNLTMARYEIANYLGLAVETTSRLFALFRERGLIDVDKRHVKIIDMQGLKSVAERSDFTDDGEGLHANLASACAGR